MSQYSKRCVSRTKSTFTADLKSCGRGRSLYMVQNLRQILRMKHQNTFDCSDLPTFFACRVWQASDEVFSLAQQIMYWDGRTWKEILRYFRCMRLLVYDVTEGPICIVTKPVLQPVIMEGGTLLLVTWNKQVHFKLMGIPFSFEVGFLPFLLLMYFQQLWQTVLTLVLFFFSSWQVHLEISV